MTLRARIGYVVLGLLVVASAAYPVLSGTGAVPDCPFGRDPTFPTQTVCDRTFGGLWRSMLVGLVAGAGSCGLALALAVVARRFRGLVDEGVARTADLFFAVPDVLVLVAVGFAVSVVNGEGAIRLPALATMIASLVAIGWAAPTRQLQNRLRSLESQEFVLAAEALGASRTRVVVRHLLPFARDYVLAIFLLRVPSIILTESTVSFLGFGLPADEPSLGAYLGANYDKLMYGGQARVVVPAWILLALMVLAFQWVGHDVAGRTAPDRSDQGR